MEYKLSMFEAIDAIALTDKLAERQLKPLQVFAEFISRLRVKAERTGREGAAVLDELLSAINYEAICMMSSTTSRPWRAGKMCWN